MVNERDKRNYVCICAFEKERHIKYVYMCERDKCVKSDKVCVYMMERDRKCNKKSVYVCEMER